MSKNHPEEKIEEKNEYAGRSESEKIVLKILESEVFDPVWFEVLRLHPELQVDSDGKQVQLERNHNLRHRVNSYRNTEVSNCLTGTLIYEDIVSCIGINDKLSALSATGQAVSSSLDLRQDGHILNDNTVNPPVSYSVDLCTEIVTPEALAAAAKKAGGKKGAPVEPFRPRRMLKYRMQIVDMYKSNDRVEVLYVKVHDIHFDCPFDYSSYDHLFALHDYVSIGLNHDGTLLSLIVSEDPALCRVYQLQGLTMKLASQIAEEREEDLASVDHMVSPRLTSQPSALKTPVIIAQWKVACAAGGSGERRRSVMECVFLRTGTSKPTTPANHTPEVSPTPEQDPFVSLQPGLYGNVKLLLRVQHCPYLVRMKLALKPEDPNQNTNKKQEKPKDKGKGAVDIPQPPPIACDVLEEKRISLSSPPS
eukprot:gene36338-44081_t